MPSKRKTYDKSSTYEDNIILAQCCIVEGLDYDEALRMTGYGKMNILVLVTCSIGLLAVGFQNGVTAYLLPIAKCDLHMSSIQMGLINVAFMIGGISSACLWGILSDMLGSRRLLMVTFLCDGVVCALSSLSQSSVTLILCRSLNGFFIGGPGCLLFTYLADFTLPKFRSNYTCMIGISFIMSWILLPSLALLILPIQYTLSIHHMNIFTSWRLYLLVVSIPSLLCATFFYSLPESPKLLLQNGLTRGAIGILRNIYTMNTGKMGQHYLVEYRKDMKTLVVERNVAGDQDNNAGRNLTTLVKQTLHSTRELFNKHYIVRTILISIIFYVNMFGCYGFGLWIPELLTKLNVHDGEKEIPRNSTTSIQHDVCDTVAEEYKQSVCGTILVGVCCLVYNVITGLISRYIKRGLHMLPAFSLCMGGGACLGLLFPSASLHLPAASLFQAAMTTGNILIVALALEAYPSSLRSMGLCIATMCGRVGSICSNLLFGSHIDHHTSILLVALLSLGGGVLVVCVSVSHQRTEVVKSTRHDDTYI